MLLIVSSKIRIEFLEDLGWYSCYIPCHFSNLSIMILLLYKTKVKKKKTMFLLKCHTGCTDKNVPEWCLTLCLSAGVLTHKLNTLLDAQCCVNFTGGLLAYYSREKYLHLLRTLFFSQWFAWNLCFQCFLFHTVREKKSLG